VKRSLKAFAVLAAIAAVAVTAGLAASVGTAAPRAIITASLISDIGRFNDKSFNQLQLEGLNKAKKDLGVRTLPLQSNSVSDYIPNMTTAIRRGADIVIAAGYLLQPALEKIAARFPNTNFAITDYCATKPCVTGSVLTKKFDNIEGTDYAANQSGCLVGVLASLMAKKQGKRIVGAVGGLKIPSVEIWIAGYKYCAQKAVPGTKVLVGYSQDFVAADKCRTVAENQIAQGAQVLFQVAGGCGLGTLQAAADAGLWGIGVDKDQYNDAKRVLTSGVKRVDLGVYEVIRQVKASRFAGGTNLVFNLENGGMSVGRINPAVPKAYIAVMNGYKKRIIAGTLKLPLKP
jgi:basic membrane protein A